MKNKKVVNVKLTPEAEEYLFDMMAAEDCSVSEIIERLTKREPKDGLNCGGIGNGVIEVNGTAIFIQNCKEAETKMPNMTIPKLCFGRYCENARKCVLCCNVDICMTFTLGRNYFALKN